MSRNLLAHLTWIEARKNRTSRVRLAPKDYAPFVVGWVAQNLMQLYGKSVQMAHMEGTEIGVEGIV